MTVELPDAGAEPTLATEMVSVCGMRVAPAPAAGAVAAAALSLAGVLGCWGLAALAEAALPVAFVGASVYWLWRWVDERRGRIYWERAPVAVEVVGAGTWVPSLVRPGGLSRVTATGLDDGRPWIRLADGSVLLADPPLGDVVTALVRPGPWHGLLDSVPVPDRRRASDFSDAELRAAVKCSFGRLATVVEERIDSGELIDRELLVDLARFLEMGMETVRACESVSGRLPAGVSRTPPAGALRKE